MATPYHSRLFRSERGFTLLEALIAFVILAIGLLAVAGLQSYMLAGNSLAKARTEAVQLAQDKLDTLRDQWDSGDYTSIANGEDTPSGTNASFTRTWTVTNQTTPLRKEVTVAVAWTDKDGAQQVALNSILVDQKVVASVTNAIGNIPISVDIPRPSGEARLPTDEERYVTNWESIKGGEGTTQNYLEGSPDGTWVYEHDGIIELVDDATGEVYLIIESSDLTKLRRISGRIYIDMASYDVYDAQSNILQFVFSAVSSVGYCTQIIPGNDISNTIITNPTTLADVYAYMPYRCYMGEGWYGNIGIQRLDSTNSNDRVCVGNPLYNATTPDPDPYDAPALSPTRTYRGYRALLNSQGEQLVDIDGHPLYTSVGIIASDQEITGHDYLLTEITGDAEDSDCIPKMKLDGSDSGVQFSSEPHTPGTFYCISGSCPNLLPVDLSAPVGATTLVVSGTVTGPDNLYTIAVTSYGYGDVGTHDCTVGTLDDVNHTYSYACTVANLGSGWNGEITVTPSTGYGVSTSNPLPVNTTSNSTGNDFTVVTTNATGIVTANITIHNYANQTASTSMTMSFVGATGTSTGTCSPASASVSKDGTVSATCTSDAGVTVSNWTGALTVTTGTGVVCTFTQPTNGQPSTSVNIAQNSQSCP